MAGKNRYGNLYRIGIGIETSYASGVTNATGIAFDDLTIHSGDIEMNPVQNTVTTKHRELTAQETICKEKVTTKASNVVIRGELSPDLGVYMKLIFNNATTFKFQDNPNATPLSAVIMQIWTDTPTGDPPVEYKVNRVTGAKLLSFNITGAAGGLIQYEATFEGQPVAREVSQAIDGTDPGITCPTPFAFSEVTLNPDTGLYASSSMKPESFALNLVNTLTDDSRKYANNSSISNPAIITTGGTWEHVAAYLTSLAADSPHDNLMTEAFTDTLILTDGTSTWWFTITSTPTALDLPNLERDVFRLNYAGKLVKTDAHPNSVIVSIS